MYAQKHLTTNILTAVQEFLKIIIVITEDTYNVNFNLYRYYECLINDICLNLNCSGRPY